MKKWTEAKITELSIEMTESGLIDGYDEFWIIVNDDKQKKKNNPVTPNPYPYLKDCTLYVQTSRFEGYGLSIAEARILNKPIVTTEFDAVYNQMIQGKNGIVVPQDSVAIADAIERLLKDKELYNAIVEFQKQEKKGNTEEIEKFYQLVGT